MPITVRNAEVDDARAVAAVHAAGLQAAYRPLIPERQAHLVLDPPDAAARIPGWRQCLERTRISTTIVACDELAVVGFCTLQAAAHGRGGSAAAEIWALFVQPSHWRQGIGSLLCERSLSDARLQGFDDVEVWELESNATARWFFRSMGFRPDGESRIFLEHAGTSLRELRYRRTT